MCNDRIEFENLETLRWLENFTKSLDQLPVYHGHGQKVIDYGRFSQSEQPRVFMTQGEYEEKLLRYESMYAGVGQTAEETGAEVNRSVPTASDGSTGTATSDRHP